MRGTRTGEEKVVVVPAEEDSWGCAGQTNQYNKSAVACRYGTEGGNMKQALGAIRRTGDGSGGVRDAGSMGLSTSSVGERRTSTTASVLEAGQG
jgi:hypothetical protein